MFRAGLTAEPGMRACRTAAGPLRCLTPDLSSADKTWEQGGGCSHNVPFREAPAKSCSQKGWHGEKRVPSQPPAMPMGHQTEDRSQHWALQPNSQNALWCLPTGKLGLQLQPQVPAARFPLATQVFARLAALPWRNGLPFRAYGLKHEVDLCFPPLMVQR